jgi:Ran GTPase-activating protein (RanGAP) involved in mRNA processing and transport
MFSIEDEILLMAARELKVTSNMDAGHGLHIIQLKETKPSFPFFALPPSPASATTTNAASSYHNQKLEDAIKKYQSYAEIKLNSEDLTDDDMQIIVNQAINGKQCTSLLLENNKISPKGVSIIASALNNSSLESLILNFNRVLDPGARFIAKALSENNCNLQTLALHSTDISDNGVQHLAEMLKTNQSLTLLGLSNNRISDRGVQLLVKVLSQDNATLQWLLVHKNNSISDAIVEPVIEMLKKNQSLKGINLSNCNLSNDGKKKLQEAVASKHGFKLDL